MNRAAIYARKSTDQSGVSEDAKSVVRQVEHARALAAAKGWTVADEHVYVDDGVSGAEFGARRPGLVGLLAAVEAQPRPFDALVMSEESRLGREAIETSYVLKRIIQAGVAVWFYLENRQRVLDSPTDKLLMAVQGFADEVERERARQRVSDAMKRKALAGHVTGGALFGYRNVDVTEPGPDGRPRRRYVTREIVPAEAEVVRRIFALCAEGEGFKTIARLLNAEGARCPVSQRGRRDGWAPSSVREVLLRETYRGVIVWNKTRKRDAWGRHHQTDRPASEWVRVEVPALRILSDAEWEAAHARIRERRDQYRRWRNGDATGRPDGRGLTGRYLLSGFAKCPTCGGSLMAVRWSDNNRPGRYVCATYWNKGRTICANDTPVPMAAADAAVRDLLAEHVLRPAIVEAALDLAVGLVKDTADPFAARRAGLEERLATVERQLANLAAAIADGNAVPAVLEATRTREAERQALMAELEPLRVTATRAEPWSKASLRRALRAQLADWRALVDGQVAEARRVLDAALADRMTFRKSADGWEVSAELAWDRMLARVAPTAFAGLQEIVASPPGFADLWKVEIRGIVRKKPA